MGNTRKHLRAELAVFLAGVLVVRVIHLALLGSVAISMNVTMAAEAKAALCYGLGNAFLEKPPLSVLVLSTAASAMQVVPARALYVVIIASHLVLALAFWFWVRSLRLRPAVRRTSLLIYVGLPLFNSYEGFDNYPTLLGAALFLFAAACLMNCRVDRSVKWLVLGTLCTWAMMLIRLEYLVLLPFYLTLYFVFRRLLNGQAPCRRELKASMLVLLAMVAGTFTTMAFRQFDAGDFAPAPNTYSCTTFLQGTPDAWLEPEDKALGDWGRESCGIRHFGHPKDYDYSLLRMVLHNPWKTIQKAVLNLPRWFFQLGRRHVVVPLPVAALTIIGLIVVSVRYRQNPARQLLPTLLATIMMTLALTATVVNAEYMVPAYAAIIVLAGHGLVWLTSSIDAFVGRPTRAHRMAGITWWVGLAALFLLMEFSYFRAGGNLPDATDMRKVAELVDKHSSRLQWPPIVLDPPESGVEIFSRSDIRNRWLAYKWLRSQDTAATGPLYSMPELSELASSQAARYIRLNWAIIWTSGKEQDRASDERLESWRNADFQLDESETTEDRFGNVYTIFVMRRKGMIEH